MSRPLHLVTGGGGFVGRHLVRALLARGASVFVVDDLSSGQRPEAWLPAGMSRRPQAGPYGLEYAADAAGAMAGQRVIWLQRELCGALLEQGALAEDDARRWPAFDDAFALASVVLGRQKIDGDPLHIGVDLAIDALFFRWLTSGKRRAERVLYASSSAAYPISLQAAGHAVALAEPMLRPSEGVLGQPDMTYGFSKMAGEYLASLAASRYGQSVAVVRPFSGYGEDQAPCYPVPAIAGRVARGDDPVEVWGSGEQGRDFIHIDDCIEGMLLAIERIGDGSAVNLGSGQMTSFRQLAALLCRLDGRPRATVQARPGMPVGVASRYACTRSMQSRLGFAPRVSLEAGMGRVLAAAHRRLRGQSAQNDSEPARKLA